MDSRTLLLSGCLLLCACQPRRGVPVEPDGRVSMGLHMSIATSNKPVTSNKWSDLDQRVTQIVQGQTIFCAFIVSGMKPQLWPWVNCNVSWSLKGPDHSIIKLQETSAKITGRFKKDEKFIIAEPVLALSLDNKNIKGVYTLDAKVDDLNSKKSSETSYSFELIPKSGQRKLVEDFVIKNVDRLKKGTTLSWIESYNSTSTLNLVVFVRLNRKALEKVSKRVIIGGDMVTDMNEFTKDVDASVLTISQNEIVPIKGIIRKGTRYRFQPNWKLENTPLVEITLFSEVEKNELFAKSEEIEK